MMCYRDRTFCNFKNCSEFSNCSTAYTDEVHKNAVAWWGNEEAPVAFFVEYPECYKEKDNE